VHLLQRAAEESTSGRLVPPREIDRCGNTLRAQVPGQVEELLLASSIVIKRAEGEGFLIKRESYQPRIDSSIGNADSDAHQSDKRRRCHRLRMLRRKYEVDRNLIKWNDGDGVLLMMIRSA
jgi:hypothetical protein